MINQFKLDKWDFAKGPSILAAFGSVNHEDARDLNILLKQMLRVSPVNLERTGLYAHHLHDRGSRVMDDQSSAGSK